MACTLIWVLQAARRLVLIVLAGYDASWPEGGGSLPQYEMTEKHGFFCPPGCGGWPSVDTTFFHHHSTIVVARTSRALKSLLFLIPNLVPPLVPGHYSSLPHRRRRSTPKKQGSRTLPWRSLHSLLLSKRFSLLGCGSRALT